MPRKKLVVSNKDDKNVKSKSYKKLEELVDSYYIHKEEEKSLKSVISEQNNEIKKQLMVDSLESDGKYILNTSKVVATLANRQKVSMNEDKLLEVAKANGLESIIKTKEYIDLDALEDLLYNNQVSNDIKLEIAQCEEVKDSWTLVVKPIKK